MERRVADSAVAGTDFEVNGRILTGCQWDFQTGVYVEFLLLLLQWWYTNYSYIKFYFYHCQLLPCRTRLLWLIMPRCSTCGWRIHLLVGSCNWRFRGTNPGWFLSRSASLTYSYNKFSIYVEDRYTTRTVLKLSGRFYKHLAGFKTGWPDLIHYVHPGPL